MATNPQVHMYDPPEGWRYGFPKPYLPTRANEPLAKTLVRDGYPKKLTRLAKLATRFWYEDSNAQG